MGVASQKAEVAPQTAKIAPHFSKVALSNEHAPVKYTI